jgi:hypothetical protein
MQSYASATLKIFVVGIISFVALSGCEKELSEVLGENHPFVKTGRTQTDSLVIPGDSIPADTLITWPDTIPFPFPHDTIPRNPIPTDSIPKDTTFVPPIDTLSYNTPDSLIIDSTRQY